MIQSQNLHEKIHEEGMELFQEKRENEKEEFIKEEKCQGQ
jgi:phosphoribosyl-ATP pyrophosphohydrolase